MATVAATTAPGRFILLARPIAVAAIAGFAVGALIGGLGGRLAMLVLRLTSDPSLHGLETDDGFTIGVVSSATMFLVVATAALGVVGGLIYLVVRTWLPPGWRPPAYGALMGVIGGSLVVHPAGVDFTVLEPLWLAVVMFVALLAAYGVVVAALVERWLRQASSTFDEGGLAGLVLAGIVLAGLALGLFGVQGLAIAVLLVLAVALPRVSDHLRSRPVVWLGRTALLGVGVIAAASLVADVADIL